MIPRFAVIGNPVAHSKSPEIHSAFSAQTGIVLSYERLWAPDNGFARATHDFFSGGGSGLNVTLPFKVEAYALSTQCSERARMAGAVNTIKHSENRLVGDNTDGAGLVADIRDNLAYGIRGRRLLIIGAGGAVRGVLGPLLGEFPESIAICNRTFSKAEALAKVFAHAGNIQALPIAELPANRFDIVINATAASLDNSLPDVPRGAFDSGSLAYDMVYGKGLTPFLQLARESGARVADGLGMLVEQAAESFNFWHGVRPRTAPVLQQIRQDSTFA